MSPSALFQAGRYEEALAAYAADTGGDRPGAVQAEAHGGMGLVYFVTGRLQEARQHFAKSYDSSTGAAEEKLAAQSAMNLVMVDQRLSHRWPALPWATELAGGQADMSPAPRDVEATLLRAIRHARNINDAVLTIRTQTLYADVAMGAERRAEALEHLHDALALAAAGDRPYRSELLQIADSAINRGYAEGVADYDPIAYAALRAVLDGEVEPIVRARSMVLLGRLYARAGRLDDARAFTAEADLLVANLSDDAVGLEIDLQEALLLRRSGRGDAERAFEQVVARVQSLRPTVAALTNLEQRAHVHALMSMALELVAADLLTLDEEDASAVSQARLRRAREALELSRLVDVEVYFADACIDAGSPKLTALRDIDPSAAVLYPILLEDRLVVLLETADSGGEARLRRFERRVARAEVARLAAEFKSALGSNAPLGDYLPASQALHQLLLDDVLEALRGSAVTTLVFSPNQELRDVPLAALHDGQNFVIQHYAVATALGLSLVDPEPLNRRAPRVLMGRLRAGDDQFRELKGVDQEFEYVSAVLPVRDLAEEAFTAERLAFTVSREAPTVLHLTTHAQFSSYAPASFIRAHQSRISLEDLRRLVSPSGVGDLDLLILSACETARGESDALLGLAGAAYQSGARSVVGALWLVDDGTAPTLMRDLYREIYQEGRGRAEALRQAQLAQIRDGATPYYWATFLVIGNWL